MLEFNENSSSGTFPMASDYPSLDPGQDDPQDIFPSQNSPKAAVYGSTTRMIGLHMNKTWQNSFFSETLDTDREFAGDSNRPNYYDEAGVNQQELMGLFGDSTLPCNPVTAAPEEFNILQYLPQALNCSQPPVTASPESQDTNRAEPPAVSPYHPNPATHNAAVTSSFGDSTQPVPLEGENPELASSAGVNASMSGRTGGADTLNETSSSRPSPKAISEATSRLITDEQQVGEDAARGLSESGDALKTSAPVTQSLPPDLQTTVSTAFVAVPPATPSTTLSTTPLATPVNSASQTNGRGCQQRKSAAKPRAKESETGEVDSRFVKMAQEAVSGSYKAQESKQTIFNSLEEAITEFQHESVALDSNKAPDDTIPTTTNERKAIVRALCDAILEKSDDVDGGRSINRMDTSSLFNLRFVEKCCWKLLDNMITRHKAGRLTSKPERRFASFKARLAAVLQTLTKHKKICVHIVSESEPYSHRFIDGPFDTVQRIETNTKGNAKKAVKLRRVKELDKKEREATMTADTNANSPVPLDNQIEPDTTKQPKYRHIAPRKPHKNPSQSAMDPSADVNHAQHVPRQQIPQPSHLAQRISVDAQGSQSQLSGHIQPAVQASSAALPLQTAIQWPTEANQGPVIQPQNHPMYQGHGQLQQNPAYTYPYQPQQISPYTQLYQPSHYFRTARSSLAPGVSTQTNPNSRKRGHDETLDTTSGALPEDGAGHSRLYKRPRALGSAADAHYDQTGRPAAFPAHQPNRSQHSSVGTNNLTPQHLAAARTAGNQPGHPRRTSAVSTNRPTVGQPADDWQCQFGNTF